MNKNRLTVLLLAVLVLVAPLSISALNFRSAAVYSNDPLSDYYGRHAAEFRVANTGSVDLSDYASRHPGMTIAVPIVPPDTSDYWLRHTQFSHESNAANRDLSDYAIRHPEARIPVPVKQQDNSDYWLRHNNH